VPSATDSPIWGITTSAMDRLAPFHPRRKDTVLCLLPYT
jgi:hypothetical protein